MAEKERKREREKEEKEKKEGEEGKKRREERGVFLKKNLRGLRPRTPLEAGGLRPPDPPSQPLL